MNTEKKPPLLTLTGIMLLIAVIIGGIIAYLQYG